MFNYNYQVLFPFFPYRRAKWDWNMSQKYLCEMEYILIPFRLSENKTMKKVIKLSSVQDRNNKKNPINSWSRIRSRSRWQIYIREMIFEITDMCYRKRGTIHVNLDFNRFNSDLKTGFCPCCVIFEYSIIKCDNIDINSDLF